MTTDLSLGASDYNDFVATDDPDYDWVIPDLLEHGDRVILTGGEGKGKSTLMRQLALMTALGLHVFTGEQQEPQRVYLVDLENPTRAVRREVKKLGSYILPKHQLTISSWPGGVDLFNSAFMSVVTRKLDELRPDLLIIGPMYKLTAQPLEREEHSKHLATILDAWREIYDLAVFLESHQPHGTVVATPDAATKKPFYRPERPVGSSLWMRWPEFGYCLEDGGLLRPWRGARDADRKWPEKLLRGEEWPWMVDDRRCLKCGNELAPRQEKYCSERCSNAARQSKYRITHQESLDILSDYTADSFQ